MKMIKNKIGKDSRKVSFTVTGYPWDYTLILRAMHQALVVLREKGGLGTYDESVIRTVEERKRISRAIDLLGIFISEEFIGCEEETKYFNELFDILREDMRSWWN